jgi:hypothetical protein
MSSIILIAVFVVLFVSIHYVLKFLDIVREQDLKEERNYEMLIDALDSKIKTETEKNYIEIK